MDDIRRQDLRLWTREVFAYWRVILVVVLSLFIWNVPVGPFQSIIAKILGLALLTGLWLAFAYKASVDRRWLGKRYQALWNGCQDRLTRFEEILKKMRRDQIADLSEMPHTIRRVGDAIYKALRRADMISHEVDSSERGLYAAPPAWSAAPSDPQSKELYRLADKNIAEYRQQYAGVMAGVQRAEAQSAVYMTTLDTLRMKMLGYRLVGKRPEMDSHEFLEALAEARAQLESIDTALEELDLGHYPKTISGVPPPMPQEVEDELRNRLEQGG